MKKRKDSGKTNSPRRDGSFEEQLQEELFDGEQPGRVRSHLPDEAPEAALAAEAQYRRQRDVQG